MWDKLDVFLLEGAGVVVPPVLADEIETVMSGHLDKCVTEKGLTALSPCLWHSETRENRKRVRKRNRKSNRQKCNYDLKTNKHLVTTTIKRISTLLSFSFIYWSIHYCFLNLLMNYFFHYQIVDSFICFLYLSSDLHIWFANWFICWSNDYGVYKQDPILKY